MTLLFAVTLTTIISHNSMVNAVNANLCPMYLCADKPISEGVCAYKQMSIDFVEKIYLTPCQEGYRCDLDKIKTESIVKCEKDDTLQLLQSIIDYPLPELDFQETKNLNEFDNYISNSYYSNQEQRRLSSSINQQYTLTQGQQRKRRPGEDCEQNSDCFTGKCLEDKKVCYGQKEESTCDFEQYEHNQCDVGLFCNSETKKCQKQSEIDEQCDNNVKCVNWGSCNFNKCVQRRSLNATQEIESSIYRDACYNFYSIKDEESGKTYCSPGPYLNDTHVCRSPRDSCSYFRLGKEHGNSKTFTETTQCSCGFSNNGQAFCPFKEGDEQFMKTLDLAYYFWSQKPKCHIGDPSGCQEAKKTRGYYTIVGSRQELLFGHELMLNSDCMKKMNHRHQRYWQEIRVKMAEEIKNDRDTDFSLSQMTMSFGVLLVTLSLILLY